MIGAIFLCFILYGITLPLLSSVKKAHRSADIKLLQTLYWYHTLFWLIYYLYAINNGSDSVGYYIRSSAMPLSEWLSSYEAGTRFISFIAYPFSGMAGFSYEMVMMLFAWFGYWGFVFFYLFYKENTKYQHKIYGYDLLAMLMFLPNMHFWTVSLGKGSVIFLGLGLATYGLSRVNKRKLSLILGLALVYYVRPHVFLFMLAGIVIGFFTGRQKVPSYQKIIVLGGSVIGMFFLYEQVLGFVGVDTENVVESFETMTAKRAQDLGKAGSGVDMSNYPLFLKLFTFWFRPLFFDAPGLLGLFVSVENLIYVLLTVKLFDKKFPSFFAQSTALVKSSIIIFIAASVALSTTMSNLGIIIRQKSMVMYFFFFLIISFIDYKKKLLIERKKKKQKREQALKQISGNSDLHSINQTS